ncbi:MAG: recombinase family protein [Phycisphaerales bacterium]
MRVIAMYRVSTERQAELGASLDAQQRKFRELAASQGWTVVAEFRGSESATQASSERQVLQQVLACIRLENPDALYVHEQSRLTRGDELEVALLLRELRERCVKIVVGGVVRDLGSIDERFMVGIQSLVDRAESERIRERVGRGKREKARQGKWVCGAAPYGYVNPPRHEPRHGTLQVVPQQAALVRRIFELAAAGCGTRGIAAILNKDGAVSPQGRKWGKTTIQRVLSNVAYLGVQASGVWRKSQNSRFFRLEPAHPQAIKVENAHEAVVPKALWQAVHGRIRPPCTRYPRLLTGLLRLNGSPAQGDTSRGKQFYRSRDERNAPWLLVPETEHLVWKSLQGILTRPEVIEACLNENGSRERETQIREQLEAAETNLIKHEGRRDRLLTMRIDGEIGKEEFQAKNGEIAAAIQGAQQAIVRLRTQAESMDPNRVRRAVAAARVAMAPETKLDAVGQRKLLASVLVGINANAVRIPTRQAKDPAGRFRPGAVDRWRIKEISFTFAGRERGVGNSATTSQDCVRPPRPPQSPASPSPDP